MNCQVMPELAAVRRVAQAETADLIVLYRAQLEDTGIAVRTSPFCLVHTTYRRTVLGHCQLYVYPPSLRPKYRRSPVRGLWRHHRAEVNEKKIRIGARASVDEL